MSIAVTTPAAISTSTKLHLFRIRCSDSNPSRGFGPKKKEKATKSQEDKGPLLQQRNLTTRQSASVPKKAPGLNSQFDGISSKTFDLDFEERLEAIRRSASKQKKTEQKEEFGPIDYDAPVDSEKKTIGLGTKIGVGAAVVVFGLLFALADFLPSGSDIPSEDKTAVKNKISEEEKAALQNRLKTFESTLRSSPKDQTALEGAAVTLTELGEYSQAASLLQDLSKERPNDPDVFRLLGEVKFELKDYEGSSAAYKSSAVASKDVDFETLRGLTNALLAAKKPDQAVQFLLASRERLNVESKGNGITSVAEPKVDPIQVELLLGKAYSDWGHISDAVAVYDQLITTYPNDFRGYLAKGIILKENGNVGGAERMFIQARFFAPENAKAIVDRYSR